MLLLCELAIIAALFWADIYRWHHIVVFSKTPYLLAIGWISLRLRGRTWRSVGMFRPESWRRALVLGIVSGCAMELTELFITQPLLIRTFHQPPDLSAVKILHGHAEMLVIALLLSWTLAALGEELVWRGYLLNRIAEVIPAVWGKWTVSLIATSLAFGLAHFDQGRTGISENILDGAMLCALYLATGRNLWVPIVAHGITDSLDSFLLFSGHYPPDLKIVIAIPGMPF